MLRSNYFSSDDVLTQVRAPPQQDKPRNQICPFSASTHSCASWDEDFTDLFSEELRNQDASSDSSSESASANSSRNSSISGSSSASDEVEINAPAFFHPRVQESEDFDSVSENSEVELVVRSTCDKKNKENLIEKVTQVL